MNDWIRFFGNKPGKCGSITWQTLPVYPGVRDKERFMVAVSLRIGPRGKRRGGLTLDVRRARKSDAVRQTIKDLEELQEMLGDAVAGLRQGLP